LAARIDDALIRVHIPHARPGTGGADGIDGAEIDRLRSQLDAAGANIGLQAQRCGALEDRIAELEAALVGERDARARAEAVAEDAQSEASVALDQLEIARSERSAPIDRNLGAALQEKLLEVERLTRERDSLRAASSDWRSKAQAYRRERDEATLALSRTSSELEELRERDAASRRKLGELERLLAERERALEIATRRAEHLRQHLGS
jgi:chromosome segregation ATPase